MWIVFCLLVIVVLLLWLMSSPFYWKFKKIPYITPVPIFGSLWPVLKYGQVGFMEELYKKFPGKKYFGIHLLTRPALFIKDPELVKKILVNEFEHFTSRGMYFNQDREIGGGNLILFSGQQWKDTKQKISQSFTPFKIKSMLTRMENISSKMYDKIDKDIDNNKPVEVQRLFLYAITDFMVHAIFGVKTDIIENEHSIFREIAYEILKGKFVFRLFTSIVSPKLYDLLKFTMVDPIVSDFFKKSVEDKFININKSDFLESVVESLKNKYPKGGKFSDNSEYDLDGIAAQSITTLTASVETTSLAITFLFYELALHPEMQKKCREEIKSIISEETEINASNINKLDYLNAAIKETLRLHTPPAIISRECTKTYKVPNSDLIIDKGTFIMISPIASHLQEQHFPEPKQFRPERFLDENKDDKTPGTVYYPFGDGPRKCVGMNLGLSSIKFLAARLLQRYEFSTCSKTQIPMKYAKYLILSTPANTIWLNARRI